MKKVSDEIKELQYEYLVETARHYNSTNRCNKFNGCYYSPETLSKELGISVTTEGCAIGRKLPAKKALQFDDEDFLKSYVDSDVKSIFNRLPINMKRYTSEFLGDIQSLHDKPHHWNETGISQEGKVYVNRMAIKFDLKTLPSDLWI